jgi:hypothetical protein
MGRGYDVVALAAAGAEVALGLELSSTAVAEAKVIHLFGIVCACARECSPVCRNASFNLLKMNH